MYKRQVLFCCAAGIIWLCRPVMHIMKSNYYYAWHFVPFLVPVSYTHLDVYKRQDQGHYGLTTGVQPKGIQGVQRLLGGLVQGEICLLYTSRCV